MSEPPRNVVALVPSAGGTSKSFGAATSSVASGGGGTHPPDMETRVAILEADMKDVKAGISRLEIAFARSEGKMDTFATAAGLGAVASDLAAGVGTAARDNATLTERLHAHGETLTKVEIAIRDLGSKVDAKMISGGQMFAIFGGLLALFFSLGGISIGTLRYLGMLH